MLPDYYKILNIGSDASDMEIKKAFRSKVKVEHPSLNKNPDALNKFTELNEAYEILIHHDTRELYEEDFQSWHNPEEYPIYKYWIEAAHARAIEHAKLPYHEYQKTVFYKSTKTTSYSIFMIGLIFGLLTAIAPYILIVLFDYKFFGVASIFIALPVGTFMLVQALAGFQSLKKFH